MIQDDKSGIFNATFTQKQQNYSGLQLDKSLNRFRPEETYHARSLLLMKIKLFGLLFMKQ